MYLCATMRVYHSIEEFSAKNPIVTIGMFDGVHAGHRSILQKINTEKEKYNGESVLLTFWPHPRIFFGKAEGLQLLTSVDEKLELLEQTGLDACIVLPFSKEFAQLTPTEYITNILHNGIKAKKVIVGYDHKYGNNGSGTFEFLQTMATKFHFEVEQIQAYSLDTENISSTKIRNAIAEGNIQKANRFLCYNYFLSGTVVHGAEIGRTIGFPTANLQLNFPYKQIPQYGVYAAYVQLEGEKYKAVINIGNNPTINANLPMSIEIHLLNFNGDIYGKQLRVQFIDTIRGEQRFTSLAELQSAIAKDIESAKQLLF